MNSFPIYIASKRRSENCSTFTKLMEEGCENCFLVVEPQDYEAYKAAFPMYVDRIKQLQANDQGITFARNSVLAYARESGHAWFWMMDDDISNMYFVVNKKCIKSPFMTVLWRAEEVITTTPAAIGAMEYQQYAWAAKNEKTHDSYCDVAVLINVEKTKHINYRQNCKEDRDMVLQILSLGMMAVRSTWTAFSAPKNGSNKGGLSEAYAGGLENHWSARMIQLWPGVCRMNIKPDGRPDVKINWKKAKPLG